MRTSCGIDPYFAFIDLPFELRPSPISLTAARFELGIVPGRLAGNQNSYQLTCRSGQRAYYATRILLQNGFQARNASGGMLSRSHTPTAQ